MMIVVSSEWSKSEANMTFLCHVSIFFNNRFYYINEFIIELHKTCEVAVLHEPRLRGKRNQYFPSLWSVVVICVLCVRL